jgi:hypothetical protein
MNMSVSAPEVKNSSAMRREKWYEDVLRLQIRFILKHIVADLGSRHRPCASPTFVFAVLSSMKRIHVSAALKQQKRDIGRNQP